MDLGLSAVQNVMVTLESRRPLAILTIIARKLRKPRENAELSLARCLIRAILLDTNVNLLDHYLTYVAIKTAIIIAENILTTCIDGLGTRMIDTPIACAFVLDVLLQGRRREKEKERKIKRIRE